MRFGVAKVVPLFTVIDDVGFPLQLAMTWLKLMQQVSKLYMKFAVRLELAPCVRTRTSLLSALAKKSESV